MADCLIGLGSNLGDRSVQLDQAIARFCGHPQIELRAKSDYHRSRPVGGPPGQGDYLNAAIRVETGLSPRRILAWSQTIEWEMGRRRAARWGPRPIDIDLLLHDVQLLDTPELTLPHPRMVVRRFVLEPACQIAPDMLHPATGWTIRRLLERLDEAPSYFAVAGPPGAGKTEMARALALAAGADLVLEQQLPSPESAVERLLSPEADRELVRIEQRRQAIMAAATRVQSHRETLLVSDFWQNQSLVTARAWFDGPPRRRIEQAYRAAVEKAPLPKLVLFLDTPLHVLRERWAPGLAPHQVSRVAANLARFRHQWRRQVALPGQGPILRVSNGDPQLAITEALGAIAAMG